MDSSFEIILDTENNPTVPMASLEAYLETNTLEYYTGIDCRNVGELLWQLQLIGVSRRIPDRPHPL
jgi:hypothetical protein